MQSQISSNLTRVVFHDTQNETIQLTRAARRREQQRPTVTGDPETLTANVPWPSPLDRAFSRPAWSALHD